MRLAARSCNGRSRLCVQVKVAESWVPLRRNRAVQPLSGHTRFETAVRYLGVEADKAAGLAE